MMTDGKYYVSLYIEFKAYLKKKLSDKKLNKVSLYNLWYC